MGFLLYCLTSMSSVLMCVWIFVSFCGPVDKDAMSLRNREYWVVKLPILLIFVSGILWPIFFENLWMKTIIHRESGQLANLDALVTDGEARRMFQGEFLVVDYSHPKVWKTPSITITNSDWELMLFLRFDGNREDIIEEAKLLAPCVPPGEDNLIPTLKRKIMDLQAELGVQFLGTITNPGFRLYGYRIGVIKWIAPPNPI